MFAPQVKFEGFDGQDWQRIIELLRPEPAKPRAREATRPAGAVIAVHSDGRLLKLLHTAVGRLPVANHVERWPLSAQQLASRVEAKSALVIELGVLEDITEQFAALVRRQDDWTTQWVQLMTLIRQQLAAGRLELWPRRFAQIPLPTAGMIERFFNLVCPPGKSALFGLFNGPQLWTCVAISRGARGIELILGPEQLRPHLGALSGDLSRDHVQLAQAVTERAGPLSLGCFAEVQTLRDLVLGASPGGWANAVAGRKVVLRPLPVVLSAALGVDAVRGAMNTTGQVLSQLFSRRLASSIVAAGRAVATGKRDILQAGRGPGAVRQAGRGPGAVRQLLGFRPLELVRQLLTRRGDKPRQGQPTSSTNRSS